MATITLAQSANGSNGGTTATNAVTLNSVSVGAGDLIVVGISWGNNLSVASDYTISDDASNNYNLLPSSPVSDQFASGNEVCVAYAINTNSHASLTTTVTVASGGNHTLRMGLYQYHSTTGWLSSPLDTSNGHGSNASTTTGTSGAITPAIAGNLIFAAIELLTPQTANSITVNSPFTLQDAGGTAGAGWHSDTRADGADIQSGATTASTTATFNWATSGQYAATIASFQPAAAGGGGVQATVATLGQFSKDIVPNLCNFDTSMSLFYGAYDDDFVTQFSGTAKATATQVYSVPLGVFSKDAINGGFDPGL